MKRKKLYSLLGDLPPGNRPISAKLIYRDESETYIMERIILDLNGMEDVPAYFLIPKNATGKLPLVFYHHSHGGRYKVGKDELIHGAPYLSQTPYAIDLTKEGYAVLAIDHWNFGERHKQSESELFKEMLWKGRVVWGMMVYDSLRAMDYISQRPEIDSQRIATLGMSMGSTLSWWLAALDERVKVCVDICCLTDFLSLIEEKSLDRHGLYYYVPGLLKEFETSDINALISPRAHFSLAGKLDPLTPQKGLDKIDTALKQVYEKDGNPKAWKLKRYDVGHMEIPEMRKDILEFLRMWL